MPQSYTCLRYHVVFSTKGRLPLIAADLQSRLFEYIGGVLHSSKSILLAAGGMPDHVHLLVGLSQELAVATALREIKAGSSRWIHDTYPTLRQFAWQPGYGAFTVSYSGLDRVKAYISRQPEHHRTRTYQEEFVELLKRHHIEYDERYLWD
jgi:REP element-mobilizing transposase RayT